MGIISIKKKKSKLNYNEMNEWMNQTDLKTIINPINAK